MTTITRIETRKRGIIGWIFLLLFWAFNALMAFALFAGMADVGEQTAAMTTEAEQTGAAIGMALGVSFILGIWMAGAVILGLLVMLTRGKKVIVETTGTKT